MILKIFLPTRILLEREVVSVTAEGPTGAFGLRPQHIDMVSPLVSGLLGYRRTVEAEEEFVAVDRGILVKQGDEVRVSVRSAVADAPLAELAELVEQRFALQDEQERKVKSAVARLEADFLRRFMDI